MVNTRKAATKFGSMVDNESISSRILDINAIYSATKEKMLMSHLFSLQETINKKGEEIRTQMKENVKLQIVFIDKMVAKLQDKIQECKRASFKTNERLNKI